MRYLALALAAGLLLAPAGIAQDAGKPPVAAPPARKPVKDPPKAVAAKIEEALKGVFGTSAATRTASMAVLEEAVGEWAEDAKDDPLRAVAWWRGVLASTLPTGSRRAGIVAEKVPYLEGREATLWVSTPKTYGPKGLFPVILTVLDRGEDPKRTLPAMYGDLLKDWIVVAVVADAKETGFDVSKEPFLTMVGLKFAIENMRVDRDRVVFDASPGNSNIVMTLGAEWAIHFAGTVLRAPSAHTPLLSNLTLGSVAFVLPENPGDVQKKAADAVRKAVPDATFVPEGKDAPEAVQKWLAALPPRRITTAGNASFTWKTRADIGERWAYWLWVFSAADAKQDRLVDVTLTRAPTGTTVDITSDNLAEGRLLLNDDIADLGAEVAVRVNGKEVWKGRPERKIRTALYWIGQTGERTLFVPAEVRFTVPADLQQPKKGGAAAGAGQDDGAAPPPPPPPPANGGDGGKDDGGDGDSGDGKDGG